MRIKREYENHYDFFRQNATCQLFGVTKQLDIEETITLWAAETSRDKSVETIILFTEIGISPAEVELCIKLIENGMEGVIVESYKNVPSSEMAQMVELANDINEKRSKL